MERLTGFGRNANDEVENDRKFLLRNWSYFELQQLIEYKANAAGIEVRYIDPYHTSQTCSFADITKLGNAWIKLILFAKIPNARKAKVKKKRRRNLRRHKRRLECGAKYRSQQ